MDCFLVSIAKSAQNAKPNWVGIFFMAVMFGFFQGVMPLVGYSVGYEFIDLISSSLHWIAFVIFASIGGKMIYQDLSEARGNRESKDIQDDYGLMSVFLLSVATSIDALASGLAFLTYPKILLKGVVFISIGSFLFSILGSMIGLFTGRKFNFKFNLIGGIILILIGVKIVAEHYCI